MDVVSPIMPWAAATVFLALLAWYARSMLGPQITISSRQPDAAHMDPVRYAPDRNKPLGGLWTSTETTPGDSEWTEAVGHAADAWRCDMADVRVYELDSHKAARALVEQYPAPEPKDQGEQILRTVGYGAIDWEAVAADYDCVHFTPYADVLDYQDSSLTYGWDIESTWHARWNFTGVELASPDLERPQLKESPAHIDLSETDLDNLGQVADWNL